MSMLSFRPFFSFRAFKILRIEVNESSSVTTVELVPDQRLRPICSKGLNEVDQIHSIESRLIRDLNLSTAQVVIKLH